MRNNQYFDTDVKQVALSKLQTLNAKQLRSLPKPWVLYTDKMPLAVLMRYEHFLKLQAQLQSLLETLETIASKKEFSAFADELDKIQVVARDNALRKVDAFYAKADIKAGIRRRAS